MLSDLLPTVIDIARRAGDAIMPFFRSDSLSVDQKKDATPVTRADIIAHQMITSGLRAINDWPVLSEEGDIPDLAMRQGWQRFWIVDPLDGTRGFIQGVDQFTVNIAIIENQRPVLGVVYEPVFQRLSYAVQGQGAFLIESGRPPVSIHVAQKRFEESRFIVGKYHATRRIQKLMDAMPRTTLIRLNSSMKFTVMARGEADIYARFGPINEWDVAAGEIILEEAGGKMVDFSGKSLQYNARQSFLCPPLLAVANSAYIDRIIALFEGENYV